MERASLAILLSFMLSIALFAALAAYLIYEDTKRTPLALIRKPAPASEVHGTPRRISHVRFAVVAASFVIWSIMLSEHLRPRH